MSAEENATLAREIHQAFNDRNYDRVDELVAQDVQWENVATGETFSGPEGIKQFMRGWVDAFSDANTEIQEVHAGDNFAVNEFAGRGTHDGTLQGGSQRRTDRWTCSFARSTTSRTARSLMAAPSSTQPP